MFIKVTIYFLQRSLPESLFQMQLIYLLIFSNFSICSRIASGSFFKIPTSRTFFLSFLFWKIQDK